MTRERHPTPLRKVVDVVPHPDPKLAALGARAVLLECGHTVKPARDFFGERYPNRRRCPECRDTSGDCPVLPLRRDPG